MRRGISRLALAMALLAAGCAGATPRPSAPSALLGELAPIVERFTLDGNEVGYHDVSNRVVVVEFFGAYCEPCVERLPAAQRLAKDAPDILVIGIGEDERASESRALVERLAITFPVVHDAGKSIAARFGVTELPAAFVVDRRGYVRWVGGPEHDDEDLRAAVERARRGP